MPAVATNNSLRPSDVPITPETGFNGTTLALVLGFLATAMAVLDHDSRFARKCIEQAAALLKRTGSGDAKPTALPSSGLAPWQIARIIRHVERHIDVRTSVPMLAELVRLSPGYFARAFRESFGLTPHTYIVDRRLDRAKELMLATDDDLAQIALACGFTDQAHLSHSFKRLIGQTPSAWRRVHRSKRTCCTGAGTGPTSTATGT